MKLIFKEIMLTKNDSNSSSAVNMNSRISKSEYISTFNKLQEHIKRGDIYEVNFCHEYFAKSAELNPVNTFRNLYEISNSPFSAFFRTNDFYLMSASPERFVKKFGNTIISQPIKGTRKRGNSVEEDLKLKEELRQCPKEQSENVMIVDLVRNDLSKTAEKSSVKVEELYGIYSFTQVHQMISTITSELRDDIHWSEVLKTTFPMGSMTGAPKIRAMQLIEEYETFKRGLYSGSVGYVTPNGDFDFNVIIRSILYNTTNGYVSLAVGSAITANAKGDDEYAECELKAKAMLEVLNA
jgi:para-aminobenzoate synthetase component 1